VTYDGDYVNEQKLVLVAGGAGFIGSHIVDTLIAAGYRVRVFDDFSSGKKINLESHLGSDRFELVEGTILDRGLLGSVVEGADAIVNMVGKGDLARSVKEPQQYHDVNVTGNLNLIVAAKDNGIKRFIFASSASVYKAEVPEFIGEDVEYGPESPYAATKICSEVYCKAARKIYGMENVILRFFNVYGPRRENSTYGGAVTNFMLDTMDGKEIGVSAPNSVRDYVYVKDVANAVSLMLADGVKGGEFNVGTGEGTSALQMIKGIEKVTNAKARVKPAPPRQGDTPRRVADITRIKKAVGYKPSYSLEAGLRELHSYLSKLRG
jgi:nucleoside-diphosphate-sugar epimerase